MTLRPTESDQPLALRLEGQSVAEIVRDLGRSAVTGTLVVTRPGAERRVLFEEGRAIFATSSDPNDRLGEYLLRRGKVSLAEIEAALCQQSSGKRLGTLMVEAGLLTRDELVPAVRGQVRAIVLDLFTWTEGECRFFAQAPHGAEDITLDLSLEQLVLGGVRQVRSLKLIECGIGGTRTVLRLAQRFRRHGDAHDLPEGARLVLERLSQSPASAEMLCREVPISNFEICQILWALRLLEIVEPVETPPGEGRLDPTLGEIPLASLLLRLEARTATGVLYVRRGSRERRLLFAGGRCVFATSNDPDDGLVHFLFRSGVISLHDKDETIRRLLSNRRVGTILRDLGAIDDDDMQRMVRQQVLEVIHDTLVWDQGDFVFVPGPLPRAEEITVDVSAAALVAEAVRRIEGWPRLVRGCGGIDNPLCLAPRYLDVLDAIGAGVAEWEVVNALRTPQTPRRICALTELEDLRVCQILWTLKVLGGIEDSPVEIVEAGHGDEPNLSGPEPPLERPDPTHDGAGPSAAPADEPAPEEAAAPESAHAAVEADVAGVTVALCSVLPNPPEPAEAEEPPRVEVPVEIYQQIVRFNAMHRVVFRAVRFEIGAGAMNFVRSCCERIRGDALDPVEGVELYADGSWDLEGLKRVIVAKCIDDPWTAYSRVLDEEFVSLVPHLGAERSGALRQQILELSTDDQRS